ncbi:MAG: hypothetical protein A2312_02570 [Candidatus Staskawiczbacteria bacterium RIFOXYB2_FULL_32_9]|uniref:PvuRts1 I-like SET and RING associated domain-containing protein n=1 Tax=Candidatus Staskawiczbacteria bacterium RIFOXYD1_FULL_32_13 TaxID=1802234 RepID=A0A1G2JSD6_9BACT|nr:MAG: hypothetical protein UR22_C0016G0006 [Parcubacteria group bacterium GW2011_GWC2_32_10]OGZ79778.1 MAG: hypothetical protein A2256_03430 [Candidatus Staskawiczbacteria bacterium RIFOXYA2_FULL_32_7]OGZ80550.1 MAG: hypothetical protein A2360_03320 [Candidatus Staskawiczbacteria bacterium RIFOXYB1_FULL_32_11]OGZ81609.1 MAG: hypothetical protein A2312_02570 [Candidatus Staskawiczbacteria bacterium RIFOXYB2_FULL_32_9]OGZ89190.1 MAG: hypothetical protein A2561_01220 [Candidatus Staskawiczbacter
MEKQEFSKKYIDKGFIDLVDNAAFRTIKDGCNCFGHNYKGYQRGAAKHVYEPDVLLWFPKINPDGLWDNSISSDGKIVIERCKDDIMRSEHLTNCFNDKRQKRIIFVRDKDQFGEFMYTFKGLYELDKNKSNSKDGLFWDRIATRVKTYPPLSVGLKS